MILQIDNLFAHSFFSFRDPTVSQKLFSETPQGQKQDRPAFRFSNKVFHEKEDRQLLLTVTKKPPISGKHSS